MKPLPLNKPCDLNGDAESLAPYYRAIDDTPGALNGQHPIRRWEYGMALAAIHRWYQEVAKDYLEKRTPGPHHVGAGGPIRICDVGGAGSNFWHLLRGLTPEPIILIDPAAAVPPSPHGDHGFFPCTVEEYAAANPTARFDILTVISVIEHVPDLRPFFTACHRLLRPGGLLFLTTDYWDAEGEDVAHFHWMRERIYNADSLAELRGTLGALGLRVFGKSDWSYAGPQCYDYSVASLALTKEPR